MRNLDTRRQRNRIKKLLDRKQDLLLAKPGILGDPATGLVDVPGRPGYDYVRIGDEQIVGEYLNVRVPSRYDLPVYVGRDPVQPYVEQVLTIRQEAYIDAGFNPIPPIPAHHETHEWPVPGDPDADGSDLVYVHWRQIRKFRLHAGNPLYPFRVYTDGGPFYSAELERTIWVDPTYVDLTDAVPEWGARWVLVYLSGTGLLSYRAGTIRPRSRLQFSDAPPPNVGELALGWVYLYAGQSYIADDATRQDIVDARYPQTTSGGVPHALLSTTHTDTVPSSPESGQIIVGDSSGHWQARSPSGDVTISDGGAVTVVGIQNISVAPTQPLDGDVLTYDALANMYVPRKCECGNGSGNGGGGELFTAWWYADGPLSTATEFDGVRFVTHDCEIAGVILYVRDRGTAGETIVDVERSTDNGNTWSSVFRDPLQRPSLAWNDSDHVAVSAGVSDLIALVQGDILRARLVSVATGARCATVQLWYRSAPMIHTLLPVLWADFVAGGEI